MKMLDNEEFKRNVAATLLAVRGHPKLGRGTCAMVDECMNDAEVADHLWQAFGDRKRIPSIKAMVREMVSLENSWRDREADVRGEIF